MPFIQCKKERSVCTVTSLAVDDTSIAAGLGSSGKVRKSLFRVFSLNSDLLIRVSLQPDIVDL